MPLSCGFGSLVTTIRAQPPHANAKVSNAITRDMLLPSLGKVCKLGGKASPVATTDTVVIFSRRLDALATHFGVFAPGAAAIVRNSPSSNELRCRPSRV